MKVKIKISGISTLNALEACLRPEVFMISLCFDETSANNVSFERAELLSENIPPFISKVAIVSNISDEYIRSVMHHFRPDYIQLENIHNVKEIKRLKDRYHVEIIQNVHDFDEDTLRYMEENDNLIDFFLCNIESDKADMTNQDYNLMNKLNQKFLNKIILAGNINRFNLEYIAIRSNVKQIDISSELESTPGVLDSTLIESFLKVVKNINRNIAKSSNLF